MPNISQNELLIIAAVIAMLCFLAITGILVLLIWWLKYKSSVTSKQSRPIQTAQPAPQPQEDEKVEQDFSAFAPPAPTEKNEMVNHLQPEDPAPFTPQTTVDLEPPPLSDHPQENTTIEPVASKIEVEENRPETEETDAAIEEIGAEDATVLMQRPPRPEET